MEIVTTRPSVIKERNRQLIGDTRDSLPRPSAPKTLDKYILKTNSTRPMARLANANVIIFFFISNFMDGVLAL